MNKWIQRKLFKTVQKKSHSLLAGATNIARRMSLVLCNVATPTGGNNDNNNNTDNASEESNSVTIYRSESLAPYLLPLFKMLNFKKKLTFLFLFIFRCRAPIASLDCMEEFSGTAGHLDFGIIAFLCFYWFKRLFIRYI